MSMRCRYVVGLLVAIFAGISSVVVNRWTDSGRIVNTWDLLSSAHTFVKVWRPLKILTSKLGGRLAGPPPSTLKTRPSDVWIITPPKSGTTLVTHMAHQLRVQGASVDFEDQDDVVPWVEMLDTDFLNGTALNRDPDGEHIANPRVFKSHLPFDALPAGSYKKVFVFREPKDALISAAKFLPTLWGIQNAPSIPQLCSYFLYSGDLTSLLESLLSVWKARHRDDVLLFFYEDILEDPELAVRRLARFMGVPIDDMLVRVVVKQTSHTEMAALHHVFANRAQATNMYRAQGLDLDLKQITGKVRRDGGRVGDGRTLPVGHTNAIERGWQYHITSRLGFADLNAMRVRLKAELLNVQAMPLPEPVDVTALLAAVPRDEAAMRQVGRALVHSASTWGVARIVGHGIETWEILDAGRRYFALPDAQRGGSFRNASAGFQRGWIPFAGESGLAEVLEVKEGFVYGYEWPPEGPPRASHNALQGSNVWPADDASTLGATWRSTMQSYYSASVRLARAILEGIELEFSKDGAGVSSVDKAVANVEELCDGGEKISLMRLFNYFPPSFRPEVQPQKHRLGSSPHTDWYLITIILRDNASRVQVADKELDSLVDRRWWDIPSGVDGELIVLFGDYLSLYTGGRLHSPVHRVLLPETSNSTSAVFLFSPKYDARLPQPVAGLPSVAAQGAAQINTLLDQADNSVYDRPWGEYVIRKRAKVMNNAR